MHNKISQAECEAILRQNVVKLRAGMRGLVNLMRKRYSGVVADDLIDGYESQIMAQLEASIEGMTKAIQGEFDNVS